MKSIFLFNIAVLFFCVGTALSVAVYSEDYGRNRTIGNEQHHLTATPAQDDGTVAASSSSVYQNDIKLAWRHLFPSKDSSLRQAGMAFPENRIFQPMAIFLFGIGLIGIATFTRRRFNF